MMKAEFSFLKAGQGSFYGGRIWHHQMNKVFTIIYDCGTSTFISGNSQSLNNEINHLEHHPHYLGHNNEIELLFISHLDYDHVSGLKVLLKKFKVQNIILPYIEKVHRPLFLVSFAASGSNNDDLSLDDYFSFLKDPVKFIQENSLGTKIYFVTPDDSSELSYEGYDNDGTTPDSAYPRGTKNNGTDEYISNNNILVYRNNLQFFIKQEWEFTTYVKGVNQTAIDNLHDCLKKKCNKKTGEDLSLDDLKNIVTNQRGSAHKCYTDYIGDINSHGLVLLHGPIGFDNLDGTIYPDCELNHSYNDFYYRRGLHRHFSKRNQTFFGTLLFGDTSIKPDNNPVNFPQQFKEKLLNVHIVQVPHHGSSENWDFQAFKALNIGKNVPFWGNSITAVCNFGYGNRYGHPSHDVLNDLHAIIFLNSQFSRLTICYDIF